MTVVKNGLVILESFQVTMKSLVWGSARRESIHIIGSAGRANAYPSPRLNWQSIAELRWGNLPPHFHKNSYFLSWFGSPLCSRSSEAFPQQYSAGSQPPQRVWVKASWGSGGNVDLGKKLHGIRGLHGLWPLLRITVCPRVVFPPYSQSRTDSPKRLPTRQKSTSNQSWATIINTRQGRRGPHCSFPKH